ncbi:hypothetical protein [Streptomyces sp. NPDC005435]|uniref:hypothetical protein n=1 Tax=Streptomyces sp. NPDC005435 TaxID=3154464 RepID=UPI0034561373
MSAPGRLVLRGPELLSGKGVTLRRAGGVLLLALAVAGCDGHDTKGAAGTPAASAPAPATRHDPHAPSVDRAPRISSDGIKVLNSAAAISGSAAYSIPGGIKAGRTLAVAINCRGAGRMSVKVSPADVSFPLACEKGKVIPTLNEIPMSESGEVGTLQVTAGRHLSWSFAVGWDPSPPARR